MKLTNAVFFGARPNDLGWSHHETLGVPRLHLRILLLNDGENSFEELVVGIVSVTASPWVARSTLVFLVLVTPLCSGAVGPIQDPVDVTFPLLLLLFLLVPEGIQVVQVKVIHVECLGLPSSLFCSPICVGLVKGRDVFLGGLLDLDL